MRPAFIQRSIFALAVLPLCACVRPLAVPFDETAASYVLTQGDNVILGSASLVAKTGFTRTCAEEHAYLVPVTAYSSAWVDGVANESKDYAPRWAVAQAPRGANFQRYQRQVVCDQTGHFRFEHVADGAYYVLADVHWLLRWQQNGGTLVKEVSVKGGQALELDLAHTYNPGPVPPFRETRLFPSGQEDGFANRFQIKENA